MLPSNQPHSASPSSPDLMAAEVSEFFDGNPAPTFAINNQHVITHWNRACELISGLTAAEMVGTRDHWRFLYKHERPLWSI